MNLKIMFFFKFFTSNPRKQNKIKHEFRDNFHERVENLFLNGQNFSKKS
jgi:hypothetical protein